MNRKTRQARENPWNGIKRVLQNAQAVKTVIIGGPNHDAEIRMMLGNYPEATVHCFEPTPHRFKALAEQYQNSRRVKVRPAALADQEDERPFYVNGFDGTNSLYPGNPASPFYSSCKATKVLQVQTTMLDAYCQEQGLDTVDLLFMDIQGAEWLALKGATELLERGAIHAIFGEVLFAELYQDAPGFCAIDALLTYYGYHLFGLYRLAWHGSGRLQWGDFLYDKGTA